jgi:DNA polymerase IIIc chi subunit
MSSVVPFSDIQSMALAVTKSGMFGLKNENQALTLMLIAQAENIAPIKAVQMYSIIEGVPSLKSSEVQSRFMRAGGTVDWLETTNEKARVLLKIHEREYISEFSMADAKRMRLDTRDNYVRMPKQMCMARAMTMGVRAIYPQCLNNMYTVDEVVDMQDPKPTLTITNNNFVDVEVTDDEKLLKIAKNKLISKLKDMGLTTKEIKEFALECDLSENLKKVDELNENEPLLLEMVEQFEKKIQGEN